MKKEDKNAVRNGSHLVCDLLTMLATGSGESGFDSGEGAWETATTSKEVIMLVLKTAILKSLIPSEIAGPVADTDSKPVR